ncbi:DUF6252 family protein [Carboxylicivirga marina]|uniref:Lipocalin-like domain-containing protein n=1 Tax=Carboxylicivirga marina TaxID=2800988 RepID=A0ABS1HLV6_9BACT|nr:DUF6252 family protein [Carboxylicivirga marina]MBK3518149.1 hypothetical protein [Carboxylicivirga marina]
MKRQLLSFSKLTLPIMLIGIVLMGSGCEKDDKTPELPPITQSGENTFGCLVNGEVWLPKKGMITTPPYRVVNNQYKDGRWIIIANNSFQTINLTICNDSVLNGTSTFNMESLENCSSARFNDSTNNTDEYFFTNGDNYNGKVTISRFDLDELIISGTFYFDAISDKGNAVQIKEGRFDLNINSYEP